jgi:hypothetical protein
MAASPEHHQAGCSARTSIKPLVDARNNQVVDLRAPAAHPRVIALVGVDDLVVVETDDALLVVPRARAQDVKHVVERLKARGDGCLTWASPGRVQRAHLDHQRYSTAHGAQRSHQRALRGVSGPGADSTRPAYSASRAEARLAPCAVL